MNFFIDSNNQLYAYDDDVKPEQMKPGLTSIPPQPSPKHAWQNGSWVLISDEELKKLGFLK